MKHKKLLWSVLAVILTAGIISGSVYIKKDSEKNPKALLPATKLMYERIESPDDLYVENYDRVSSVMKSRLIKDKREIIQEYIIADDISFAGIRHIDIKIFADATGEIVHKFYNSQYPGYGDFVINDTFVLNKEESAQVINVFENNDFWELSSEYYEDGIYLDGNTAFIEGISGNKYNFVCKRTMGDTGVIQTIYDEIMEFTDGLNPKSDGGNTYENKD